jgi:heme oxygenase
MKAQRGDAANGVSQRTERPSERRILHDMSDPASVDGEVSAVAGPALRLRKATERAHQRLERRVDVKTRFASPRTYKEYLGLMYGFCGGIEVQLDAQFFGSALPDYESRRKLPLLTRDLAHLGVATDELHLVPTCPGLPACTDVATAFGCLYVVEGATLGGRTLMPLVESRLGYTRSAGAQYLASYGDQTTERWQQFSLAIDAWCRPPERFARAARAAIETFAALEHWLSDLEGP